MCVLTRERKSFERGNPKSHIYLGFSLEVVAWTRVPESGVNVALDPPSWSKIGTQKDEDREFGNHQRSCRTKSSCSNKGRKQAVRCFCMNIKHFSWDSQQTNTKKVKNGKIQNAREDLFFELRSPGWMRWIHESLWSVFWLNVYFVHDCASEAAFFIRLHNNL